MNQRARWMTRDFVFTAPIAFPCVVASEPERFELRPSMEASRSPRLFVLAREAQDGLDLDQAFAGMAADILQCDGPVNWSIEPVQLLGRDARRGVAALSADRAEEAVELVLVRGRDERPWVFAWRADAADQSLAANGLATLLQTLQERPGRTDARLLRSQFEGQDGKRLALANAAERSERHLPDPSDPAWEKRLAAALAVDEATTASMITDAVALVEEPYGDPVPLGASRIGGGADLPPGAWPTDARGMRHPFLMQIDLAEVTSACGPVPPLPEAGLLSFFVHDDALLVDVVYTAPGTGLVRFPMTADIIEASHAAIRLRDDLPEHAQPGPLPHDEGDHVAAVIEEDGTLTFSHSPDPVWAHGAPGAVFDALSDDRWACVASARLRPVRTRSIDLASALRRIENGGTGSEDELQDVCDDLQRAPARTRSDVDLPQIHRMAGHALFGGWHDCRQEVADRARREGHADLTDPQGWMVLARVNAGSATGREFWDALDLSIMAPTADVIAGRWDRCILLAG